MEEDYVCGGYYDGVRDVLVGVSGFERGYFTNFDWGWVYI
jgi:hypothetical protein